MKSAVTSKRKKLFLFLNISILLTLIFSRFTTRIYATVYTYQSYSKQADGYYVYIFTDSSGQKYQISVIGLQEQYTSLVPGQTVDDSDSNWDSDLFHIVTSEDEETIAENDVTDDLTAADFGGGTTGDLRKTLYEMYSGMTEPTAIDMDLLTINNDPDCSLIETIYDMVLPLGYGFALLYFFLEFVDHATSGRGETDYKYMMWLFIKLVLVEEIIRHGKYLINVALEFGNWMLYKVSQIDFLATSLDGTDFQTEIIAAINELGFFQCLAHLPTALLCQIIMLIPAFMISLHAITRKLEIIIRCGCLPLALPNMFSEGTRSGGMRYLKKLLAVMLHGFMMYLIVAIAGSLSVSVHVSFEGLGIQSVLTTALYSFAAVGLISAGKTIVNDVFGV